MPLNPGWTRYPNGVKAWETGEYSYGGKFYSTKEQADAASDAWWDDRDMQYDWRDDRRELMEDGR